MKYTRHAPYSQQFHYLFIEQKMPKHLRSWTVYKAGHSDVVTHWFTLELFEVAAYGQHYFFFFWSQHLAALGGIATLASDLLNLRNSSIFPHRKLNIFRFWTVDRRQNKQFEDVALGFGKLWRAFFFLLAFFKWYVVLSNLSIRAVQDLPQIKSPRDWNPKQMFQQSGINSTFGGWSSDMWKEIIGSLFKTPPLWFINGRSSHTHKRTCEILSKKKTKKNTCRTFLDS